MRFARSLPPEEGPLAEHDVWAGNGGFAAAYNRIRQQGPITARFTAPVKMGQPEPVISYLTAYPPEDPPEGWVRVIDACSISDFSMVWNAAGELCMSPSVHVTRWHDEAPLRLRLEAPKE